MIFFLWLGTISFIAFAVSNIRDGGLATFFWALASFFAGVILIRSDQSVSWTYAFNPVIEYKFALLCFIASCAMCAIHGLFSSVLCASLYQQLYKAQERIKELERMVLDPPPG